MIIVEAVKSAEPLLSIITTFAIYCFLYNLFLRKTNEKNRNRVKELEAKILALKKKQVCQIWSVSHFLAFHCSVIGLKISRYVLVESYRVTKIASDSHLLIFPRKPLPQDLITGLYSLHRPSCIQTDFSISFDHAQSAIKNYARIVIGLAVWFRWKVNRA